MGVLEHRLLNQCSTGADSVALSSEVWKAPVAIKSRAVQIISGADEHFEIDFGGLIDAIFVESDGILGLYRVTTRNIGPKSLRRATQQLQYETSPFGPWPSIQLAPGATMYTSLVTFYTYSEPAWQQCVLFQNFTADNLRAEGYTGSYTITGRNSFTINDYALIRAKITDLRTNHTAGQAKLFGEKVTIICAPDPFVNFAVDSLAPPANQASTSGGVPWWVALLSAVGALLVSVLSAWLLIYIRSRRPSRAADLEKTPPAPAKATPPENGAAPVCQRCSEDSLAGPQGPGGSAGVISKAQNGHSHGLIPQRKPSDAASFSTTDMCGPDDDFVSAPTTGPSSTNTANTNSITDMTSLPDILRARSAMLVGALELGAPLGRGSYGKVYKGKWKGVTVAVKIVEHTSEANGGIRQLRESILSSSIIHPNVVSTYKIRTIPAACAHPNGEPRFAKQGRDIGAYASDPTVEKEGAKEAGYAPDTLETWLLLEFCDRGNLDRAIMQQKEFHYPNGKAKLESMYRCLIDMAAGMDYLHSLGVINGDLKPANVLLKSTNADSRGFTCKLADFGLSRVLDTNGTHVSTQTYGTLAYQPAELLRDGKLTKAVDIYSFGMIMWELYSGRRLFENNITGQVFYKVLMGFRPTIPADMAVGFRNVMEACWQPNDAARPTFDVILRCLQRLLDEHMQIVHGMEYMPTIQQAFSDEQDDNGKPSKASATKDSPAFFNQLQAAARQARNEITVDVRPSAKRQFSSAGIVPILESAEANGADADGPQSSDSYVQINSLGGTLQESGGNVGVHARMQSWERANSGSLTPEAGTYRSSSMNGGHSFWQPTPERQLAGMELSPFTAAVKSREGLRPPQAGGQPPGATFGGVAQPWPPDAAAALPPMGVDKLRAMLAGRAAANGDFDGPSGAGYRMPELAGSSGDGAGRESSLGHAPSMETTPMGLDDLASMLGRKKRRPVVVPPLSPRPPGPVASVHLRGDQSSGDQPGTSGEPAEPNGLAIPGQVPELQEAPVIPPGSLAERYLQELAEEEAAEEAASAAAVAAGDFPAQHSGRSMGSELLSEERSSELSGLRSPVSDVSGMRASSSTGRSRPTFAEQHSVASTRTSSELRDERIIAEEQRDAPDGLAELDDLIAGRRPRQGGSLSQAAADALSLLQSPAETPTSGRPPTGPQGQLLRDVFGNGNIALRQSLFGGFTAVEQGESIKHLGPRISLTPARSGPVDGASRTEIEMRGRNGGPTAGAHLPQKASLHLIRRDGRTPGAAGGAADANAARPYL
ncbi:hypothetical protein WJX75_005201 [Coccomyxa subellipsoidea]|uniref:Protein kinase domain-containing protein n=1 Tax=Coccomyxa subellipsoidea TaxID=248742 RepID=A0ABR2YJM2_9CHLO